MRTIKVGEYEVIEDLKNGVFKALRHGEEWQNLIGNNFVLALIDGISDRTVRLTDADRLLTDAHDLLDNVHCYDTETYRNISKYFNGEEDE